MIRPALIHISGRRHQTSRLIEDNATQLKFYWEPEISRGMVWHGLGWVVDDKPIVALFTRTKRMVLCSKPTFQQLITEGKITT